MQRTQISSCVDDDVCTPSEILLQVLPLRPIFICVCVCVSPTGKSASRSMFSSGGSGPSWPRVEDVGVGVSGG